MNSWNKNILNLEEKEDILAKAMEITKKKVVNPNLIDATIGTLYDENHQICVLNVIKESMKELDDKNIFAYNATQGPATFEKNLISYLFKQYKEEILKSKYIKVIPTPGATGAINSTLAIILNEQQYVLIPSLCWNVYFNMCDSMNLKIEKYNYIKDNHFDLDDFINHVNNISKTQKEIVTILNDPCNNPTGYSLSDEEFDQLIQFMNSRKDLEFTLIYDVAYYEYSKYDSRKRFAKLKDLGENVFTILTWSSSKAFTLYGLRVGAMVIIDSNKSKVEKFYEYGKMLARLRWSCTSTLGLNGINNILSDENKVKELAKELNIFENMLYKRVELFEKEAKEISLNMIPYRGGFFVSIPCNNPKELTLKLEQKDIYVIANDQVIRIAICGINLNEVKGLAKKIKECL